jgi:hypothetical protein
MSVLNQVWCRGGTEEQVDYIGDVVHRLFTLALMHKKQAEKQIL